MNMRDTEKNNFINGIYSIKRLYYQMKLISKLTHRKNYMVEIGLII